MKPSKFLVLIACVSIAAFGCSSPSSDESSKGVVMDTKTTMRGAELSVSLPGKYHTGEEVASTFSLKNNGKSDLFYGHTTDYNDFRVTIHDSQGKLVPFTRFGEEELSGTGEGQIVKKYFVKKLAPGETLQHSYNLERLFDLTVAGKYKVSVSIEINPKVRDKKSFTLESKASLEIVEP